MSEIVPISEVAVSPESLADKLVNWGESLDVWSREESSAADAIRVGGTIAAVGMVATAVALNADKIVNGAEAAMRFAEATVQYALSGVEEGQTGILQAVEIMQRGIEGFTTVAEIKALTGMVEIGLDPTKTAEGIYDTVRTPTLVGVGYITALSAVAHTKKIPHSTHVLPYVAKFLNAAGRKFGGQTGRVDETNPNEN